MATRDIVLINEPRLREKSKKVKKFGPELKNLTDDMLETMHAGNGVGLAAPQVGILQRILVAQIPPEDEDGEWSKPYVLVNPEVIESSTDMEEGEEGCLSIPGWYGYVRRPQSITVKAKDVNGKNRRIKADGYLARVLLHEMDHLEGVLFIDHIDDPEKLWQVVPREETEEAEESAETDRETVVASI